MAGVSGRARGPAAGPRWDAHARTFLRTMVRTKPVRLHRVATSRSIRRGTGTRDCNANGSSFRPSSPRWPQIPSGPPAFNPRSRRAPGPKVASWPDAAEAWRAGKKEARATEPGPARPRQGSAASLPFTDFARPGHCVRTTRRPSALSSEHSKSRVLGGSSLDQLARGRGLGEGGPWLNRPWLATVLRNHCAARLGQRPPDGARSRRRTNPNPPRGLAGRARFPFALYRPLSARPLATWIE